MGRAQILPDRPLTKKEKSARYRAKYPERCRAATKEWRKKHKEYRAAYDRRRGQENPVRKNQWVKEWRKNNPGKARDISHRYRARKLAQTTEGKGASEFMQQAKQSGFQLCYYCMGPLSAKAMHFDHVVPLSRGGLHCASNLVVACVHCNASKRQRTLSEWRARPHVPLGCDGLPFGGSPLARFRHDRYWGLIPWQSEIPNHLLP